MGNLTFSRLYLENKLILNCSFFFNRYQPAVFLLWFIEQECFNIIDNLKKYYNHILIENQVRFNK